MFFNGKEQSPSTNGKPLESSGGSITLGGHGQQGSGGNNGKSMDLWITIIVPNIFFLLALSMNLFCFVIMVIKSQCTFTTPLNLLMMSFLLTMAYYSLNNMVCSITGEALGMEMGTTMIYMNQAGDLFSSYYSVSLLFLVGMNRFAVYSSPWLVKNFFPRKRLIVILVLLALICLALSIFIYQKTGMSRVMQTDGVYEDYVEDMTLMTVASYVSYGIALSSCLFYASVFRFLRQQRSGASHTKTKEMLDKAEAANCRQGCFILFIYSVSLVTFILSSTVQQDSLLLWIHAIQEIVQCLPSLAIPTSLICFCPEMQNILKFMLSGGKRGRKIKHGRSSADSLGRKQTITGTSVMTM